MERISKLGKITEIIGKIIFYFLIISSLFVVVSYNISKTEKNPETSILIGSILGGILALILIYYFWRLLFRPIYNLNKNIILKIENQISEREFKKKWIISLICSLIFGVLFIVGSFGISLLTMIPQYVLLIKSKEI